MSNIVLIHGAYQGGWIWQQVADRLRTAGHRVYHPTLDGCGERAHALRPGIDTESHGAEIAQLLYYEDLDDVILVGTSSGGMVLASAAERARERIERVVFADALALFDGEKIRDIVTRPASVNTELALGPDRDDMETRMLSGLESSVRSWAADRVTLHPQAVFNHPVKLPSFWQSEWNASVLYCTQAPNPGKAHIERCATTLNARWHEIDTGHYPMLSTPDELCDFILNR